jgi:dTDP-4-amino-4,6-dideoxygalactose transaminase
MVKIKKPYPSKLDWYSEPNLGSYFDHREINAVMKCLKNSNKWHQGFNPYPVEIYKFEKEFEKKFDVRNAISVCNNGLGFDLLLSIINIKPGDEIITPALNFKAWQMSIIKRNIKTKFCDVELETLNLCKEDLLKKINNKTKVICPVYLGGHSCDCDEIQEIANYYSKKYKKKIFVIYDAARGLGIKYKNKHIASLGDFVVFSFNGAKILTTMGEGGIISTNNDKYASLIRSATTYGGEESWGLNYRISRVQAAFGLEQLKSKFYNLQKLRYKIGVKRNKFFSKFNLIQCPIIRDYSNHNFYLYNLILKPPFNKILRDRLIKIILKKYKINLSYPKNITERWKILKKKYGVQNLKNTNMVTSNSINLMLHPMITSKQEKFLLDIFVHEYKQIINNCL